MVHADRSRFDLIRGGYARHGSQWVWWTCAGRALENFFGLGGGVKPRGGSMLALTSARPRADRGRGDASGPLSTNGGFPPFFGVDSGYVAWLHVARRAYVPQIRRFSGVRRLIANLTTRRPARAVLAGARAVQGRPRGGASPFPIGSATPHVPRVRRGEDLKNLPVEVPSAESSSTAPIGREISFGQMGSGVRVVARRRNLAPKGAESSRIEVGQGNRGAPQDVGTLRTLCLAPAPVNGVAVPA